MSDQTENKGSIGIAGYAGSAAVGAGAAWKANDIVAKRGISDALNGYERATDKFTNSVDTILQDSKNKGLAQKAHGLDKLKTYTRSVFWNPENPSAFDASVTAEQAGADITKVRFMTDKATKGFAMYVKEPDTRGYIVKGIKQLPEGFVVNKTVTDPEKIGTLFTGEKSFVKTIIAQSEKGVLSEIKKAGPALMGLRNAGWGGKSAIIGTAVAGTAAGALVAHTLFGGKHSNAARAPEQEPQVAAGAGR